MAISAGWVGVSFIATLFYAFGGCTSPVKSAEKRPRLLAQVELPNGVTDRRREFAVVFCRNYQRLEKHRVPCERWLHEPPSEAIETSGLAPMSDRRIRDIVIIPGIFGECIDTWVTPFSTDYSYLKGLGYRVWVIPVTGRGSTAANAQIIHEFFSTHSINQAAVIGYSKGTTDFMLAASQLEARRWSARVTAFIAISGVVNGTLLAAQAEKYYRGILEKLPADQCPPSDGNGIQSLTYQSASATAQSFFDARPPYPSYSVTAVTTASTVNPILRLSYEMLKRQDSRNDGQVLVDDAIIRGSTYLGSFNADHWSIALPFEQSNAPPMLPFGTKNHFPRRTLIVSILDFVDIDARTKN